MRKLEESLKIERDDFYYKNIISLLPQLRKERRIVKNYFIVDYLFFLRDLVLALVNFCKKVTVTSTF